MMIRLTAQIIKSFIEEKEFFLYPYREVQDLFDIVLHKQIWFRHFFIDFAHEDFFLQKTIEEQKEAILQQYNAIKAMNKFNTVYFYKIIFIDENRPESLSERFNELFQWLRTTKIRIHIFFVDWKLRKVFSVFKNFSDSQEIEIFLSNQLYNPLDDELQEINFGEIERKTKQQKGYFVEQKNTYFTYLFMIINVLVFFYISAQGGTTNIYNLIRFGAKYNPLIAAGEYYRLITNIFIHIGIWHLLLNTYALKALGKDIESIFGSVKFILIYLISGLFGSLGSFIFSKAVSAGASGAIFGLMGAYLYFGIRKPAVFSFRYGLNILSILAINIIFGLSNPSIDNYAHIGGLIGGYLTSSALGLKKEPVFKVKRILFQFCTILLIIILFFTGITLQQQTWQYSLHKGIQYLEQNDLRQAEIEFENGLKKNPRSALLYFYLGYIHYQQGNKEEAIDYFQKALELDPNDATTHQFLQEIQGTSQ